MVAFAEFAERLGTSCGGCCLWIGAGASIALTRRATPSWPELVKRIADDNGKLEPTAPDLPDRLEELSQLIGHETFRQALRAKLIDPVLIASLDLDVAEQQAIIGARAGSMVSFNVEAISATPFTLMSGQSQWRTFRERTDMSAALVPSGTNGAIGKPIYFPHGLLPLGNVVMTKSEYTRHLGSVAVATAVHLAIGSDLVILGMSLADQYLRDAILQNRRWLRDVYWLGDSFGFREWARVAKVTCLAVDHADLWRGLAAGILAADTTGGIAKLSGDVRPILAQYLTDLVAWHAHLPAVLDSMAQQLLATPLPQQLAMFAEVCVDAGYPLPTVLAGHSAVAGP